MKTCPRGHQTLFPGACPECHADRPRPPKPLPAFQRKQKELARWRRYRETHPYPYKIGPRAKKGTP